VTQLVDKSEDSKVEQITQVVTRPDFIFSLMS